MTAVSIEEAKRHLRITTNDDDELLEQKIAAAEDHVAAFVGSIPCDADSQPIPAIREAILQQVAFLYDGTPVDLGGLLTPFRAWSF